jgi:Gas vesicle protein
MCNDVVELLTKYSLKPVRRRQAVTKLNLRDLYCLGSREFRGPREQLHAASAAPTGARNTSRMPTDLRGSPSRGSTGLVDVLDRVLDKGLVVAGDIKVSLAEVELLTIRIRLMICSIDKAEEIGLDWWKYDRHLSPGREQMMQENLELREQLRVLERRLASATRVSSGRRRRGVAAAQE